MGTLKIERGKDGYIERDLLLVCNDRERNIYQAKYPIYNRLTRGDWCRLYVYADAYNRLVIIYYADKLEYWKQNNFGVYELAGQQQLAAYEEFKLAGNPVEKKLIFETYDCMPVCLSSKKRYTGEMLLLIRDHMSKRWKLALYNLNSYLDIAIITPLNWDGLWEFFQERKTGYIKVHDGCVNEYYRLSELDYFNIDETKTNELINNKIKIFE